MAGPQVTALQGLLHGLSSGLLIPAIIGLLLMMALAVVELGGLAAEIILERRHKKPDTLKLIDALQGLDTAGLKTEIEGARLYRRQKAALLELVDHGDWPPASLRAAARRLLAAEEARCLRITDRTDLIARLSPMLGLMGTLIPLGPGIIALSQGDTRTLAESLLIAFDTTVAGLAAAAIAFAVSRLRKRWYEDDLEALSALMEGLLEVLGHA